MEEKYQDHEVSGVRFETNDYPAVKYYRETTTPKIIKLVTKYSGGAVKDERQAEYVLLGFVVVAIIVSLFLFFGNSTSSDLEKIIPKKPYIDPPKPWATNP